MAVLAQNWIEITLVDSCQLGFRELAKSSARAAEIRGSERVKMEISGGAVITRSSEWCQ
jgi:hypothetical protein